MRPDLCWGSFLSCRFEALTGYIVVVSLFIFIKKLKDRHLKEHLFVEAMPVFFDIVGFIASVIALAGGLRNLITEIQTSLSNSFGERFADYLTNVERVLTLFMDEALQGIDGIRRIVESVRDELQRARNLVSCLRDTNGLWRIMTANKYAKNLEKAQTQIGRYVGLMLAAAVAHTFTLRVQEHNGNEDLYHIHACLLHEQQLREANLRDEGRDHEIATAMQISFDEQASAITIQDTLEAMLEEREEEEEIATAMRLSFDEEMARAMEDEEIARAIEDEEIARAVEASRAEYARELQARQARDAGASRCR